MNNINWDTIEYFTEDEFTCQCGCNCCNVSLPFLNKLVEARKIAGIPFNISSGCRCKKHNASKEVGGEEDSLHISSTLRECEAADIECNTDRKRGIILRALFESGLSHIGINFKQSFIHTDSDSRIAVWTY